MPEPSGSSSSTMEGHKNGRAIKLSYVGPNEHARALRWTANESSPADQVSTGPLSSSADTQEWTVVERDSIVCLTLRCELLYVVSQGTGKDTVFELKKITIPDPSESLKNDFSVPAASSLNQAAPSTNVHVIVSVGSGTRKATAFYNNALKPLLDAMDVQYTLHETTSESFIKDLTSTTLLPAASAGTEQLVFLLSGDGGLVDILDALSSATHPSGYQSPTVILLPTGTGNALANSIGVLKDKTNGLRTAVRGKSHRLPTFSATFSTGARIVTDEGRGEVPLQVRDGRSTVHGCVVCSWCLHAALVADSDTHEYRKHGADRFKMAAKDALFPADGSPPHPYKGKISFQSKASDTWQTIDRPTHGYVLSTPVSQLEAGFTISPASEPFDGVLRLVHFAPLGGEEAMGIMGKAYQGGSHIKDARVGYEAVRALRIEFGESDARWRRICVDGTIVKVESEGWVEVRMDSETIVNVVAI